MYNDIEVLIPTYNEEGNIENTILDLKKKKFKYITILDAQSEDNTVKISKKLGCKIIIDPQKKMGFGYSLINGIKNSNKKYCCIFDGDGSFDSDTIPTMYNEIIKGNDFVFCSRYLGGQVSEDDTLITRFGNSYFTFLINFFFNFKITDALFLYCMAETKKFKKLNLISLDFRICTEILIKANKNYMCKEIFSREARREFGVSKVNKVMDGLKLMQNIFKYYLYYLVK